MAGAKIPPDTCWPFRGTCDWRVSTCPAGVQFTKSLLVESGTPGKKVKDEFTR